MGYVINPLDYEGYVDGTSLGWMNLKEYSPINYRKLPIPTGACVDSGHPHCDWEPSSLP